MLALPLHLGWLRFVGGLQSCVVLWLVLGLHL